MLSLMQNLLLVEYKSERQLAENLLLAEMLLLAEYKIEFRAHVCFGPGDGPHQRQRADAARFSSVTDFAAGEAQRVM